MRKRSVSFRIRKIRNTNRPEQLQADIENSKKPKRFGQQGPVAKLIAYPQAKTSDLNRSIRGGIATNCRAMSPIRSGLTHGHSRSATRPSGSAREPGLMEVDEIGIRPEGAVLTADLPLHGSEPSRQSNENRLRASGTRCRQHLYRRAFEQRKAT